MDILILKEFNCFFHGDNAAKKTLHTYYKCTFTLNTTIVHELMQIIEWIEIINGKEKQ